jgi:hypothetical protein
MSPSSNAMKLREYEKRKCENCHRARQGAATHVPLEMATRFACSTGLTRYLQAVQSNRRVHCCIDETARVRVILCRFSYVLLSLVLLILESPIKSIVLTYTLPRASPRATFLACGLASSSSDSDKTITSESESWAPVRFLPAFERATRTFSLAAAR